MIADEHVLAAASKFIDCVAICARRLGQEAVVAGLTDASDWRRSKSGEIADRQRMFCEAVGGPTPRFSITSAGGFFAWTRHGYDDRSARTLARRMLDESGLDVMPGDLFDPEGSDHLRLSFANLSPAEIDEVGRRLSQLE